MLAVADGAEEFSWDPDPFDSSSEDSFCDCPPPPPPRFVIPPPPAPPSSPLCRGSLGVGQDLHFCQMEPVGAEFTQTAFPSLPVIAVCSSVVLVAVLVATFLLWKHKRKVQNFLPCKTNHQGRCDMGGSSAITYDDVLINHHPTRLPNHHPSLTPDTNRLTPIELLDVKYGNYVQSHPDPRLQFPAAGNLQPTERMNRRKKKEVHHHHHHPIYEEVSAASDDNKAGRSYDSDIEDSEAEGRTVASEDEFAEDELSVAGEFPAELPNPGGKMHSLERNKDGHPSFQAKQNYYLNKSMLGPDFAEEELVSPSGIPAYPSPPPYPLAVSGGNPATVAALYNPGRIPEALLRELGFNQQVAPMSSRSLPVPPSCRAPLFTVETPAPFPLSRTRSGSATEFRAGYQRPPTPPPPENIYASIDDVGPFTIDGGRHRGAPFRKGFGRVPSRGHDSKRPPNDQGGTYTGDIRPARTACS